jgi:hypothetical protein
VKDLVTPRLHSSRLSASLVDRRLVHKQGLSEVFLTGWDTDTDKGFVVTAQWPRMHWFYGNPAVTLNPLLVIETVRQAWLLLSHSAYGAAMGTPLALHSIGTSNLVPAVEPHPYPTEVILQLTVTTRYSGEALKRLDLQGSVFDEDGHRLADVSCDCTLLNPDRYNELRGCRPIAPTTVDVYRPRPLTQSHAGVQRLHLDAGHPVLFDHPGDHIPGMYFLAAALDAATHTSHRGMFSGVRAEFFEYVDVDQRPHLVFERLTEQSRRVRFVYNGNDVAAIDLNRLKTAAVS